MYKITIFIAVLGVSVQAASGQSTEDSVKNTIMQLFDGMRAGDSTMVRNTFASEARLLTITDQEGQASLREVPLSVFLKAVGSPHEEIWDEQIDDCQINIDGNMATAWTPYHFYRSTTFSHCGVNAFQLYLSNQGWKIIQITDTRRVSDCDQ